MNINTDPKRLDKTNQGQGAVLTREDGSTQSCIITDVFSDRVRLEWRTGPRPTDYLFSWVLRSKWPTVTLFQGGSKFLVVE